MGLVLALIWKIVDVLKYALARNGNGVVTQLVVWVAAVFVVIVAANADLTEGLRLVGGRPLGTLNGWSLFLAGLLLGSGASTTVDFKKALDGSDSAAVPPLTDLTPLDRPGRARPSG